ncbi:MAG: NADH-quinone oxidoreductase subunit NuoH [Anaerolineae bacterium]|nr:NADH-quinone oxidoreductase subunit NuoH [Anaerolineae bacterium]
MFGPGESSVVVECASHATCTVIHSILTSLILFVVLLTGFAYTTVLERRFLAFLQARVGPNRAGPYGLLQPVADGIKLIFKEDITPAHAQKVIFWLAPVIKTVPALLVLAVVPFGPKIAVPWFDGKWYRLSQGLVDVNVGVLWLLGITSIGVYGVVLAGWSSNNKYAMLGGLRSSAQMISYELSMSLAMVVPVMLASSMSVGDIIEAQNDVPILGWFVFQNPMAAAIMAVALLAEVNRAPFDMPEAEQELTAGYHSEYSGMKFAMFYLAEYIGMIAVSAVGAAMYFGGYHFVYVDQAPLLGPLVYGAKVVVLLLVMIWVRGTLPRIRYDRLMAFGWKVMLPFALVAVAWSAVAVVLDEEVGGSAKLIMAVIAWVLFLAGASFWLGRVGRKPEPVSAPRVEVVSLGRRARPGLPAFTMFNKVRGVPTALARTVSGRGARAEGEQSRPGGKRPA